MWSAGRDWLLGTFGRSCLRCCRRFRVGGLGLVPVRNIFGFLAFSAGIFVPFRSPGLLLDFRLSFGILRLLRSNFRVILGQSQDPSSRSGLLAVHFRFVHCGHRLDLVQVRVAIDGSRADQLILPSYRLRFAAGLFLGPRLPVLFGPILFGGVDG